jgi:hypothetical protein
MKFLTALGLIVLITALSMKPDKMEVIEEQIEESEALHDSAMIFAQGTAR